MLSFVCNFGCSAVAVSIAHTSIQLIHKKNVFTSFQRSGDVSHSLLFLSSLVFLLLRSALSASFFFAWLFSRPTSFIQLGFALCTRTHTRRDINKHAFQPEKNGRTVNTCVFFSFLKMRRFFFAFIAFKTRCSSRVGFPAIRTCVSSRSSGASTHLPALRCLLSHLFCECVCVVHRLPTICALKQERVKIHTFLFVDATHTQTQTQTHIGSTLLRM